MKKNVTTPRSRTGKLWLACSGVSSRTASALVSTCSLAASLESEIQILKDSEKYLYAVNMGATAIGTGINVPKGYNQAVADELAKLTKKPIVPATDMLAATWDQSGFVAYSSALKSVAIKLSGSS